MKVFIIGKLKEAETLNEKQECLYRWKSNKKMSFDMDLQAPAGETVGHVNEKSMPLIPRFEVQINWQDCGFVSHKLKFLSEQFFYGEKGLAAKEEVLRQGADRRDRKRRYDFRVPQCKEPLIQV